jgi:hypothetical protein
LNTSKVWRKIKGIKRTTRSKEYEQAYLEAVDKLEEKES